MGSSSISSPPITDRAGEPVSWARGETERHCQPGVVGGDRGRRAAEAHPADAPDKLAEMAKELGFLFPFCYDESQETAKAYTAACTPDIFLFDAKQELAYRGQLDDSRPGNDKPSNGKDLRAAIDAVLAGQPVNPDQKPSIGCNIKWKPGNEPPYYG